MSFGGIISIMTAQGLTLALPSAAPKHFRSVLINPQEAIALPNPQV
jgi:hypothetical protein